MVEKNEGGRENKVGKGRTEAGGSGAEGNRGLVNFNGRDTLGPIWGLV